jgi:hypothetical protein
VEKAVVQHLLHVVLAQLAADFLRIVFLRKKRVQIVDTDAVDLFHYQHMPGGKRLVDGGAGNVCHVLVEAAELGRVVRLV